MFKSLRNMKRKQKMFLFYGGIVLIALYFLRQYLKNMEGFATTPIQQNSYYSFVPAADGKSQSCKPYKGDCLVNNIYSDAKCTVPIKCVINYPPVISKTN